MPVVLPDLYSSVLGEAVVGDWGEGPAGEDWGKMSLSEDWGKMSLSEDWVMPSHYDMHLEAAGDPLHSRQAETPRSSTHPY